MVYDVRLFFCAQDFRDRRNAGRALGEKKSGRGDRALNVTDAEIERVQRERGIEIFGKGAARRLRLVEGGGDATLSGDRSDGRRARGEQERLDGGVVVAAAAARKVERC